MTKYIRVNTSGKQELTRAFYRLGLIEKYEVIAELESQGLMTYSMCVKMANAILQHSSDDLKNNAPVLYIRKIAREAVIADVEASLKEFDFLKEVDELE